MAKLYFNYGTMCSGKSTSIIGIVNNYERQGKYTLVFNYKKDNRFGSGGNLANRDGIILSNSIIYDENTNFRNFYVDYLSVFNVKISCILIDEAQFLTKYQVMELATIVDNGNIPVICYGLKSDYRGILFEGSYYLLVYADKISEQKTVCSMNDCNNKATMNLRYDNNKPVFDGEQIIIGDLEYKPVCRKCYLQLIEKSYPLKQDSVLS